MATSDIEQDPSLAAPSVAHRWLALGTASLGLLLVSLNNGLINVALPAIAREFAAPFTDMQWLVAIYPLMTSGLTLTAGYVSDMVGRKPIFILGTSIYALVSLLSALAPSLWLLMAFRALQAVAGAVMLANTPAIIADAFPAAQRGRALGVMNTVATLGFGLGPSLGGVMVDHSGWRSAFLLPLPASLVVALLAAVSLKGQAKKGQEGSQRFDVFGPVFFFVSTASLLAALTEGQDHGWATPAALALAALVVVGAICLFVVEGRVAMPALDPALIGNRLIAAGSVSGLIANLSFNGLLFLSPFYLTVVVGYSPSEVGVMLTMLTITCAFVNLVGGGLADRFGSRELCVAGAAGSSLALAALGLQGDHPDSLAVALIFGVYGVGMGLFFTPNASTIMGAAPRDRLSTVAALYATIRQFGTALGVTVGGLLLSSRLSAYGLPATGQIFATLSDSAASVAAFRDSYLGLAFLCGLGIITSLVRGAGTNRGGAGAPATIAGDRRVA